MNKIVIPIVAVIVILLTGIYIYYSGKEYVVKVSEQEIVKKVGEKLPITKRYFLIFEITLENPRVLLEEGSNRVRGGLDVVFNVRGKSNPKPLGGSVDISGGVKYEPETGEFYLTTPFVDGCGSFVTTAPDPKSTAWPWLHRCVAHVPRRPLYAASFVSSGIGGPG